VEPIAVLESMQFSAAAPLGFMFAYRCMPEEFLEKGESSLKEYMTFAICLGVFESVAFVSFCDCFSHLLEMDLSNLMKAKSSECLYSWSCSDLEA